MVAGFQGQEETEKEKEKERRGGEREREAVLLFMTQLQKSCSDFHDILFNEVVTKFYLDLWKGK